MHQRLLHPILLLIAGVAFVGSSVSDPSRLFYLPFAGGTVYLVGGIARLIMQLTRRDRR